MRQESPASVAQLEQRTPSSRSWKDLEALEVSFYALTMGPVAAWRVSLGDSCPYLTFLCHSYSTVSKTCTVVGAKFWERVPSYPTVALLHNRENRRVGAEHSVMPTGPSALSCPPSISVQSPLGCRDFEFRVCIYRADFPTRAAANNRDCLLPWSCLRNFWALTF